MVNSEIIQLRERYEALQTKYEILSERVSRTEGRITDTGKQTIWQFVIFMVGVAGLIIGLITYQTSVLEKRFDGVNQRIDRVERNLDEIYKELRSRPR